jgi:hypothetical protein
LVTWSKSTTAPRRASVSFRSVILDGMVSQGPDLRRRAGSTLL